MAGWSLWEIAIKVSIGKLTLAEPYDVFMNQVITSNHLIILPITVRHTTTVISLPFHHRDPFDRLLHRTGNGGAGTHY